MEEAGNQLTYIRKQCGKSIVTKYYINNIRVSKKKFKETYWDIKPQTNPYKQ